VLSFATSLATILDNLTRNFNLQMLLSVGSACVTGYFWLVKANRERAGLCLYRTGDFRLDRPQCCDAAEKEKAIWYGAICVANPSTLPALVVQARVQLRFEGRWLDGQLVQEKKDEAPWTIEPLRALSRSLGCAFQVPEGAVQDRLQGPQQLRFVFTLADGRQRVHALVTRETPPVA